MIKYIIAFLFLNSFVYAADRPEAKSDQPKASEITAKKIPERFKIKLTDGEFPVAETSVLSGSQSLKRRIESRAYMESPFYFLSKLKQQEKEKRAKELHAQLNKPENEEMRKKYGYKLKTNIDLKPIIHLPGVRVDDFKFIYDNLLGSGSASSNIPVFPKTTNEQDSTRLLKTVHDLDIKTGRDGFLWGDFYEKIINQKGFKKSFFSYLTSFETYDPDIFKVYMGARFNISPRELLDHEGIVSSSTESRLASDINDIILESPDFVEDRKDIVSYAVSAKGNYKVALDNDRRQLILNLNDDKPISFSLNPDVSGDKVRVSSIGNPRILLLAQDKKKIALVIPGDPAIKLYEMSGPSKAFDISPDGKYLARAIEDNQMAVRRISETNVAVIPVGDLITDIRFSNDSKKCIALGMNGRIVVHTIATKENSPDTQALTSYARALAFPKDPFSSMFTFSALVDRVPVIVFEHDLNDLSNVTAFQLGREGEGETRPAKSLAFLGNRNIAALSDTGKTISVYDIATRIRRATVQCARPFDQIFAEQSAILPSPGKWKLPILFNNSAYPLSFTMLALIRFVSEMTNPILKRVNKKGMLNQMIQLELMKFAASLDEKRLKGWLAEGHEISTKNDEMAKKALKAYFDLSIERAKLADGKKKIKENENPTAHAAASTSLVSTDLGKK